MLDETEHTWIYNHYKDQKAVGRRALGLVGETTMTDQEFHQTRQMFFVLKGSILLAPRGCSHTHAEWLQDLVGNLRANYYMETSTRGYLIQQEGKYRLVCYTADFQVPTDLQDVIKVMDLFGLTLKIDEVGLGAIPGPKQPWEPKILHGATPFYIRNSTPEQRRKREELEVTHPSTFKIPENYTELADRVKEADQLVLFKPEDFLQVSQVMKGWVEDSLRYYAVAQKDAIERARFYEQNPY